MRGIAVAIPVLLVDQRIVFDHDKSVRLHHLHEAIEDRGNPLAIILFGDWPGLWLSGSYRPVMENLVFGGARPAAPFEVGVGKTFIQIPAP